jgi:hypothetical protein
LNSEKTNRNFSFSKDHELRFNKFFEQRLEYLSSINAEHIIPNLKRIGLSMFRVAMILTTLRCWDKTKEVPGHMLCAEEDFKFILNLANLSIDHACEVFENMRYASHLRPIDKFLSSLPNEFNRSTYLAKASSLSIKDKSAQKYIDKLKSTGKIIHSEHNVYRKVNPVVE